MIRCTLYFVLHSSVQHTDCYAFSLLHGYDMKKDIRYLKFNQKFISYSVHYDVDRPTCIKAIQEIRENIQKSQKINISTKLQ